VDAVLIEAVPAGPLAAFAVALEVGLALLVIEQIVLAGDEMEGVGLDALEELIGRVELGRLGEMRDVAGVDHEGGIEIERIDPLDRLAQGRRDIRVGFLAEADMAVADLDEAEFLRGLLVGDSGGCRADQIDRCRDAAHKGPEHSRSRPRHALQQAPPVQAVVAHIAGHLRLRGSLGFGTSKMRDRGSGGLIPEISDGLKNSCDLVPTAWRGSRPKCGSAPGRPARSRW